MTSISAEDIVSALKKLHERNDPEKDEFFTTEEIVEEITGEDAPEDVNSSEYRAFVSSTRTLHKDPTEYFHGEFADIIRRDTGSGFKGWEFRLVTAEQIRNSYERSGFEGTGSHERNKETLGLWHQTRSSKPPNDRLHDLIQAYHRFHGTAFHDEHEAYKWRNVDYFQDVWTDAKDLNGEAFIEKLFEAWEKEENLLNWRDKDYFKQVARESPDKAATVMKNLLGDGPLETRLRQFNKFFDGEKSGGMKTASYFLASCHPQEYVFYKYTEHKQFFEDHDIELGTTFSGDRVDLYIALNAAAKDVKEQLDIEDADLWHVQDLIWFYNRYWPSEDVRTEIANMFDRSQGSHTRLYALKLFLELSADQDESVLDRSDVERHIRATAKKEIDELPGNSAESYVNVGTNVFPNYSFLFADTEGGDYGLKEEYAEELDAIKHYVEWKWETATRQPSYFLVSQTRQEELEDEFLQAPYTTKDGDDRYVPSQDLSMLKKDDIVFHYQSGEIVAYSTVTADPDIQETNDGKRFYVDVDLNYFDEPVPLSRVRNKLMAEKGKIDNYYAMNDEGGKAEGYLKRLTQDGGEYIMRVATGEETGEDQELYNLLKHKKQVILYGPPGTGKTYRAKRLAEMYFGGEERSEIVTFHPSMSYEEFIEGMKAENTENGIDYPIQSGVFKQLCERAQNDPDNDYLLIIDEINRGNLESIFGELITILEKDKRGDFTVTLPYSKEPFTIPENLYIIGTMNTSDRSIALMDVALRRRFVHMEVNPDIDVFIPDTYSDQADLEQHAEEGDLHALSLLAVEAINASLMEDGFESGKKIGHSYFFNAREDEEIVNTWRYELIPLLKEYFFDNYQKLEQVLQDTDNQLIDTRTKTINDFTADTLRNALDTIRTGE